MAPELADGPATESSDIYALGIVLYEMLTGHVPFKSETPMGTCLKHINERPAPPSTLNPAVIESVEEVVLHALEKKPAHRFKTAHDLAQAYRQALLSVAAQKAHARITKVLPRIEFGEDEEAPSQQRPQVRSLPADALLNRPSLVPLRTLSLALCAVLFLFVTPMTMGLLARSNAQVAPVTRRNTPSGHVLIIPPEPFPSPVAHISSPGDTTTTLLPGPLPPSSPPHTSSHSGHVHKHKHGHKNTTANIDTATSVVD
jgi:serine/threonine protein kinase